MTPGNGNGGWTAAAVGLVGGMGGTAGAVGLAGWHGRTAAAVWCRVFSGENYYLMRGRVFSGIRSRGWKDFLVEILPPTFRLADGPKFDQGRVFGMGGGKKFFCEE